MYFFVMFCNVKRNVFLPDFVLLCQKISKLLLTVCACVIFDDLVENWIMFMFKCSLFVSINVSLYTNFEKKLYSLLSTLGTDKT